MEGERWVHRSRTGDRGDRDQAEIRRRSTARRVGRAKPAVGQGQDRGNSGIFLLGMFEIQVVDSYRADTYADGQAGALYGQYPPLANASRPPGHWQTYDIAFRRPRFDHDGKLTAPPDSRSFTTGF